MVALLNAEINRALQSPTLKTWMDSEGAQAAPGTPEAFGSHIAREIERWKPVVAQAGIKPE